MSRNYLSQLRLSLQAMFVACAFMFLCLFSAPAFADCSTTTPPTCAFVANNNVPVSVTPAFSFSAGDATAHCEMVKNGCPATIMVPTDYEVEWQSFIAHHKSCVTLSTCPTLTVALTASPTTVLANGTSSLSWTITRLPDSYGTISCQASSTDGTWSSPYSYATSVASPGGSVTVTPNPTSSNTTTYTLTCQDSAAVPASGTATVTVDQALAVSVSANPTTVAAGGSTALSYTVTDSSIVPFSCTASNTDGDNAWTGSVYSGASATLSGSDTVTPAPPTGQTSVTYTLTCTDNLQPSGVSKYVTVGVGCANSAPANGTISAYPDCTASCNSGYTLDTSTNPPTCTAQQDCSSTPGELWNGTACVPSCPNLYGSNTAYLPGVEISGNEAGFSSPKCVFGTASAWIYQATDGRGIPTTWTCSSGSQTPARCAFFTKCQVMNAQGCQ